jgi:exodeoxyribonuclease VII small subunit
MAKAKATEPTFEQSLLRLEKVLEDLEHGNLPLEEALKAFEEGVRLVKACQQKLDEVEQKVELLLKDEAGRWVTRPFLDENNGPQG